MIKWNTIKFIYQNIKLINDLAVSKFVTRKSSKVSDLSGGQYSAIKKLRFKTSMLRSDLCDSSDAYIVVKGTITVTCTTNINKRN